MSNPLDPLRTVDQDQHPSVGDDRDETNPHRLGPPSQAGSQFGLPTAAGEVGTLGPYRVLKQLGAGGMGAVYLALDNRLGRKVAIKVMLPQFATDIVAKERFLREARATALVSHDNVVTVYEADEREGLPYIAMQFLQGYTLDEYLKTKGDPPLPHVVRIAHETALGLAAAHALGLVHRDIKPANLWLEAPNGRVKVLDFGLAKPIGRDSELTKSGAVVGTPAYMSPEQARGAEVDHCTDLFSLGGLLYRLCTGKTPFSGPNVMAVLIALSSEDPTPVRELNPMVPQSLATLIHQLLAKKPEDRPRTAEEVAKRLRAIQEQCASPPVAEPPVPLTSSTDASTSQPVVVNPLPRQPPVVVPLQISAAPEEVYSDPGAGNAGAATGAKFTYDEPTRPGKSGGKVILIATGIAVLLATIVGVIVSKTKDKDRTKTEIQVPESTSVPVSSDDKPSPKVAPELGKSTGALPATYKNALGMEFVLVGKGTGWLGGRRGIQSETTVVIEQDFYLGKYEVTQGEWAAVMERTPSAFSRTGSSQDAVKDIPDADLKRFPVENVSWEDCQLFVERLNKMEKESGWGYRLPKRAEWEYACRGGPVDKRDSAFDFYLSKRTNTLLPEQANFTPGNDKSLKRTCRVGSYEPNSLGLHDMHGNVWEWCEDTEQGADVAGHRVARGGGWDTDSDGCRAGGRLSCSPSGRDDSLGLRLARFSVGKAGADR